MASASKKNAKCSSCNRDFGKKIGIQCDACEEWFHSECQSISDEHCQIFGQYKSLHWYCDQCNKSASKLWNAINNITARQDKVDLELEKLSNKLKEIKLEEKHITKLDQDLISLREELKVVPGKVGETDTKLDNASGAKFMEGLENRIGGKVKMLKQDLDETLEIVRKKGNLVLHGVKELHREDSEEDGKEHD